MKWDNWISPVEIISTQMRTEFDGEIMKAIQQVGITVDKEELVRCMNYDRNQYENGYNQGRADACGTIGVTEDGEYIMYNGHLYKKVADRVKGAEE